MAVATTLGGVSGRHAVRLGRGGERVTSSRPRSRLNALTGLRFLAAMHVVAYHIMAKQVGHFPRWLRNVVDSGYIGVDLFFVLSGFILAYTYLPRYAAGANDRREFWVARLARVYPVYAFALIVSLPFFVGTAVGTGGGSPSRFAVTSSSTIVLMQSWLLPARLDWNAVGWSLSVEAFFYALFPWIGVRLARLRPRYLVAFGGVAWAAALVPPLLYYWVKPDGIVNPPVHASDFWVTVVKYNPLCHLPEFLLGAAAGAIYVRRTGAGSRGTAAYTWAGFAAATLIIATLVNADRIPFLLLHNGLLAAAFTILIYALATGSGPLARVLGAPTMVLLGEASYALYLLHFPLSDYHAVLRNYAAPARLPYALDGGLYLVVTVVFSILVLRYVEEPARDWVRARFAGPRIAPAAVVRVDAA